MLIFNSADAVGIPSGLSDEMRNTFSAGVSPYDDYSIRVFADEVKRFREQLNNK